MTTTSAQSPSALPPVNSGANAHWVVFSLDKSRYALPLITVERIVRAAAVTPLPLAPPAVLGAIEVAGRVLPVFDLRHRFRLPRRGLDPTDQFLIARAGARTVVLVIDAALEVIVCPASATVGVHAIVPRLDSIRGLMRLADGLALIHDLEQLLSADDAELLDRALNRAASHAN